MSRASIHNFSAAIVAAILIAPGVASADKKNTTANVCSLHQNDNDMSTSLGRSVFGGVSNLSTSRPMLLVCPILRDATDIDFVRVWASDFHGFDSIVCTLRIVNSFGDSGFDFETLTSAEGFDTSWKPVFWNVSGAQAYNHAGGTVHSYQIACSLPARSPGVTPSSLANILVQEVD